VEKIIAEYERRLEKLKSNPLVNLLEEGDFEILETEWNTLENEIEGMKEYPDRWKGRENHPETHFEAIQNILEKLG